MISINTIIKFSLFLLISLVSLTSHTLISIPPPIIYLSISIFLFPFLLIKQKTIYFDNVSVIILIYITYLLFTQFFFETPFRRILGAVFSPLYYIVIHNYIKAVKFEDVQKFINIFLNLSIFIFTVELYFRLTSPIDLTNASTNFIYAYKNNSIMYSDSNGTGIHILMVFVFLFFLETEINIKHINIKKIILFILLIGTFSRAAWITGIVFLIANYFYKNFNFIKLFFFIFFILLFLFVVYPIYLEDYFKNDLSLNDHMSIFETGIDFIHNVNFFSFFIGIGISLSEDSLGRYAHNYFLTTLIETGFIGLILNLLVYFFLILKSKVKILVIIIPFFLIIMSSNLNFVPFLFMILSVSNYLINKDSVICD